LIEAFVDELDRPDLGRSFTERCVGEGSGLTFSTCADPSEEDVSLGNVG
jgi:hypothetical protein